MKEIIDLEDFKHKIRKWVPENCACRLSKDYVSNLGFVTLYDEITSIRFKHTYIFHESVLSYVDIMIKLSRFVVHAWGQTRGG